MVDVITLNQSSLTGTFNNDTATKTYDYAAWFSTDKPIQCPLSSLTFFFSSVN